MAVSGFVKNSVLGTLTLFDGAGASLACDFDMGDTALDGLREFLNEVQKFSRRGRHVSHAPGDRTYPTLAFSALVTNIVGSAGAPAAGTPLEFMTRKGAYAGNASTTFDGAHTTFGVRLTIEGTGVGDADDERVALSDCVLLNGSFAEGVDGNKLSFSIEVLGDAVVTNGSNTATFAEYGA